MALPLQTSPLIFHTVVFAYIRHLLNIEFITLAAFRRSPFSGECTHLKITKKPTDKIKLIYIYILNS